MEDAVQNLHNMPTMSFADRLRTIWNPRWPAERAYAQFMLDYVMQQRSQYKAAQSNRLNQNWNASGEHINKILSRELPTMRARSRYLYRNTPLGTGAMNAFIGYVIGTGITCMSTIYSEQIGTGDDGEPTIVRLDDEVANDQLDDQFESWQVNVDVTAPVNNPRNMTSMQILALRSLITDGEVFARFIYAKRGDVVPMWIELIPPESLAMDVSEGLNKNKVLMGIELDGTGRPVAYWIKTADIMGNTKNSRIPAEDMIHFFPIMQAGQLRGVPFAHSVLQKIQNLDDFENAELIACKIAACFSVFFTRARGQTPGGDLLRGNDAQIKDTDGNKVSTVQPGMIMSIPEGADVKFAQPQKPGVTFDMFTKHGQRLVGSGYEYGLSYQMLTRDTSGTTYAGGRLSRQMDFQTFRQLIAFFNQGFNRPIRTKWMDVGVSTGKIDAPGYFQKQKNREHWSRHDWIAAGWEYAVNPEQDVAASRDACRAGFSNLAEENALRGRDWRVVFRMAKKIKRVAASFGLTFTSDAEIPITTGKPEPAPDPAAASTAEEGNTNEEQAAAPAEK